MPSNQVRLCVGSFDARAEGRAARPDAGRGSLSDSIRLVTAQQHKYNTITSPTVILTSSGVASSATALQTSRFYTANSFCLTCLKKNLILYQTDKCMLYQEIQVLQIVDLTYFSLRGRVNICLLTTVIIVNQYSAKLFGFPLYVLQLLQ